jgi:glycosyltransferase involved in cell wall biosynthesis
MRIVFLSYSDFKGGASMAAYSIFNSLKKKNFFFLTASSKHKKSIVIYNVFNKIQIFILRLIEKTLIFFFNKKKYHQSLNIFNTFMYKKIKFYKPDIINLHWINRSMISLSEINKFNEKIVISLHDMWFFNSTEHYFEKKNNMSSFLDRVCWEKKKNLINKKNIFFIAHNRWMLNKVNDLYPHLKKKIFLSKYYPINTKIFKPRNKFNLRKKYNLPLDKKIILFSAQDIDDKRKGYLYFKKILTKLSKNDNFYFLSLGNINKDLDYFKNYKHFKFLSNNETSEIYSLSDIYLCTSIIDNLPLTILEALSSGNLVISFKNGGATELLKNLGQTFRISDINKLIKFIKNISVLEIKKYSDKSRKFALKNFKYHNSKKQYQKIFNTIHKFKI